ncbi:MAG: hypothetical protein GF331_08380 [Chitinivibrionales bacterium]|nr:hypothetical protein [Chitinivibrionales bacterium]
MVKWVVCRARKRRERLRRAFAGQSGADDSRVLGAMHQTLSRAFGCPKELEEGTAMPLWGSGISNNGLLCGMLWSAAMGVDAESYRRHKQLAQVMATAMTATQDVMRSFKTTAGSARPIHTPCYNRSCRKRMLRTTAASTPGLSSDTSQASDTRHLACPTTGRLPVG